MQRLPNDQVELGGIVYPDTPYPGYDPQTRKRNRRRIGIFLIVVIVSLLIGFSYTFLRPAVYESSATLLITPPAIDERANDVTNAQHVELELQFMTRHALLSEVLDTCGVVGQIIGDGPLAQVIFSDQPVFDYRTTQQGNKTLGRAVMLELFRQGIFLNPMGTKLYLSLSHTREVCDIFIDRFKYALQQCGSHA